MLVCVVCVVCVVCFTYVVIEACNVQGAHLFLCFFSSVMCVALCVCVLYVSCVCRASVVRLSCVCRASIVRLSCMCVQLVASSISCRVCGPITLFHLNRRDVLPVIANIVILFPTFSRSVPILVQLRVVTTAPCI